MEYLLKSSGILLLFYACYKLFLEKETFFTSNRWFFLTGIITSLVCPLLVIPIYKEAIPILVTQLPTATITTSTDSQIIIESFDWMQLATNIYLIGVALLLAKLIINLISLLWLINEHPKKKNNAFTLIETKKDISPFSFFHFIVFNPAKYKTAEIDQIILHEKVHAYQRHSIDILLSQLLLILCWFNPIAWLYKKEIAKNLEFIADEETVQHIQSKKEYQHLLIKTSLAKNQLALTNSFNNSFIKKRITMLQKNKSSKRKQWKYVLITPFLLGFIFLFNTEIIAQEKPQEKYLKYGEVTSKIIFSKIITKNSTEKELQNIKKEFKRNGAVFNYNDLKYNNKNEIISVEINLKHQNGSSSSSWNNNSKNIQIGIHQEGLFVSENVDLLEYKNEKKKLSSALTLTNKQKQMAYEFGVTQSAHFPKDRLFIKDGKIISKKEFKKLNSKSIKAFSFLQSEKAMKKYGEKAKEGAYIITTQKKRSAIAKPIKIERVKPGKMITHKKALHIINDSFIISKQDFDKIERKYMESISIMKPQSAMSIYGNRAKYGAVNISLRKNYLLTAKKIQLLDKN
jgi:hypothetical protein